MSRQYPAGPKHFVFAAGDGEPQSVTAADPQTAFGLFRRLFRTPMPGMFTVTDMDTGERIVLVPGDDVILRADGAQPPRSEYLDIERGGQYTACAMLFFEGGFDGVENLGRWLPAEAAAGLSPEERGAVRAATFTTEAAAIEEVLRIWADSGIVDPTDEYLVFFESFEADRQRVQRGQVLKFIELLGLEKVDAPAGAASGEVWVRRDPRLDDRLEDWA